MCVLLESPHYRGVEAAVTVVSPITEKKIYNSSCFRNISMLSYTILLPRWIYVWDFIFGYLREIEMNLKQEKKKMFSLWAVNRNMMCSCTHYVAVIYHFSDINLLLNIVVVLQKCYFFQMKWKCLSTHLSYPKR